MSYEWLNSDVKEVQYHTNQSENPKQYTKNYYDYLMMKLANDTNSIVNFGCGAVTNLFAQKYPEIKFLGLDINTDYISTSNKYKKENSES
ncbi:hypothetical protein [Daejeonella sp. H1SJ63]|uniref:hypothetical protein n=1 Tax=Daejeonella sp. H1SJ63 TaxID=3034145 RepID=UPI0023EAA80C|nr:hypothetical protein [Daejeonella sp. H1SJ63]